MPTRPISPKLQKAFADLATSAPDVSAQIINHLADSDLDAIYRLEEAHSGGHRVMLAIDIGTPDPQVRLISVDAQQSVQQIAALGVFPPSDRRN